MMCISRVLLLASALISLSQGAKILTVFPMGSRSHYNLGFRLVKELIDRGHEVTFISSFSQNKPLKNLREISVAEAKSAVSEMKKAFYEVAKWSFIRQIHWASDFGITFNERVLQVKEVQELINSNEHFDLVLVENFFHESFAVFQYKFNCPLVLLAPGPNTIFNNYIFANPSQPAYAPNLLAEFGSDMTLWERILNVYYDAVGELYINLVHIPKQNDILQRNALGAPNIRSLLYNTSFMLLASHISFKEATPFLPNIKEIGGYHLTPPKPLPKEIQDFMDQATEGVIVFSMGSLLKGADFPKTHIEAVLKVFSRLKQKVLWKFERELPEKSENVKIVSWMPQQDVLAHPNVVVFVSHGGLLGKTEAIYHGVPVLGLPVFWDQLKNCQDSTRQGFALTIPFPQLTEDNFERALNELTNNSKYKENAKMRSKIIRDQPVKQIDEAMFWIEYVIRHKGAPHFRSAALNLKWYQRLLIDVILVVGIIVALTIVLILYILKTILNDTNMKVLRRKNSKKVD